MRKTFGDPLLKWAEKSANDKKQKKSYVTKINCSPETQANPDPMSFILAYQLFSLGWTFFCVRWGKKRHEYLDENLIWRLCEHKHTQKKINLINYTYKLDYSHFTSHTHKRQIINHWITKDNNTLWRQVIEGMKTMKSAELFRRSFFISSRETSIYQLNSSFSPTSKAISTWHSCQSPVTRDSLQKEKKWLCFRYLSTLSVLVLSVFLAH